MSHPQMDSQSGIMNIKTIHVARACKAKGNEWWSKIPEMQLRLKLRYNASRENKPFVTVLDFEAKLGLDIFLHLINKSQPTMERHNATSQALTSAEASEAKQANLYRTLEPKHKVEDNVLLSINNINIKNVLLKMKPL